MAADFPIVFTLYPRMTQLDFTGPYEVFWRLPGAQCILASATGGDMEVDGGIVFANVRRLADIERCALICVPGGLGTIEAIEDAELLAQVRRLAATARYVTSVCTGALLLGAAGLLRGYRATTHWLSLDLLPLFGAQPVEERVVIDRNRITGGGVTAGIDFGLFVAAQVFGPTVAQEIQLMIEYSPDPPFDSGSRKTAPQSLIENVSNARQRIQTERRAIAERVARRSAHL